MSAVPSTTVNTSAVGCTCFKLRSLSRRVTQLYDHVLAPSGLKVTQYSLIAHARRRNGASAPTVTELAQQLYTDRTTLTRNLKPLVDAGLIAVEDGADARSKGVVVTAEGESAYQAARVLWKEAQSQMRERAGEPQLAALHQADRCHAAPLRGAWRCSLIAAKSRSSRQQGSSSR